MNNPKDAPGESAMRMSKIVRTIADVLFPFAMVFGIYIIIHGHLTPGGGFQGGAATASAIAMLIVAYGSIDILHRISEHNLTVLECAGALIFGGIAAIGLFRTFFYNFLANTGLLFGNYPGYGPNGGDLNTGGVLPIMNIGVGLCVVAGLVAILLVMAYATTMKPELGSGNSDVGSQKKYECGSGKSEVTAELPTSNLQHPTSEGLPTSNIRHPTSEKGGTEWMQ